MTKSFHMPVYQTDIFEAETEAAFRSAFPKLQIPDRDRSVDFVEFRFHVVGMDDTRVIAEKFVTLHPDPKILSASLSEEGNDALRDIMVAWVRDEYIDQAISAYPFPWDTKALMERMKGRYVSLYWRPEFSVLAQEFIPTFLLGDDLDPLGDDKSKPARTAMASLILPQAKSAHDKIRVHAGFNDQSNDKLTWLWKYITAEEDNPISMLLDDVTNPEVLP